MGTIVARKRKDGTVGYSAQIVIKRGGRIVHRESQTFSRRQAAVAWARKREETLAAPGALDPSGGVTLADAIERYTTESLKEIGRTKAQVLRAIGKYDIAKMKCADIASQDIVAFAQTLGSVRQPQTVGNYLSHLAAVFAIAEPAWGYPLNRQAMKDASAVLKRLGTTSTSQKRGRRPSIAELDALMEHYAEREMRNPEMVPMTKLIPFAIFSTRRQEEITRIAWADYDPDGKRIMVRDMKNPGEKIGNDVWCDLTDEAIRIIDSMPRAAEQIFPVNHKSVGSSFTRACKVLGIEDLHFHDLRHDGVSRLFEMGWNIPHVAAVSGHRSWSSLKRYTHLRQTGDKYKDWKWLETVT